MTLISSMNKVNKFLEIALINIVIMCVFWLPVTIHNVSLKSLQSRMSIIKINTFTEENLKKIMNKICDKENITITRSAEKFILSISNNSIRILINYLEKLKLLDLDITLKIANQVCTNIPFHEFTKYTKECKSKNIQSAIKQLYILHDRGYSCYGYSR